MRRLGRIHTAHRKAHAALAVDLEHLDAHDIAFLQLVTHPFDAFIGDLRDVHEAVAARQDRDEGAKIHQARNLALIDAPHLDVRRDEFDATLRLAPGGTADGCDLDRAIIFDIDRGAGLFGYLADHRSALA